MTHTRATWRGVLCAFILCAFISPLAEHSNPPTIVIIVPVARRYLVCLRLWISAVSEQQHHQRTRAAGPVVLARADTHEVERRVPLTVATVHVGAGLNQYRGRAVAPAEHRLVQQREATNARQALHLRLR